MNDAMATVRVAQSATVILEWNSRGASLDVLWETVSSFAEHLIVLVDPQDELVVSPVLAADPRFSVLTVNLHSHRGDALAEGIQRALELPAKILVLTDSATIASIPWERLLARLHNGTADCVLGYPQARLEIRDPRWLAHFAASITQFLARAALGYWNCPCPVSRCVALRSELFGAVRLDSLHRGSFFEPSLLARLYLIGAVVDNVSWSAPAGHELFPRSVREVLFEFPYPLLRSFLRRLILKNFLYDFSLVSLYLVAGLPLLGLGLLYGGFNFWWFTSHGQPAPTGTVVIPTLLIILGVQLLLSAVQEDLRSVPTTPLCRP